jgi:hypothetical protein
MEFTDKFEQFLQEHKKYNSYITGDFNIDLLKHNVCRDIIYFSDMMFLNSFSQLIKKPIEIQKKQ